ncbi:hypothetical protein C2845_PM02G07690 [Panicum miliaceum]|uniref:Uncharacterized protein n=1 Tax=Panicum miliaceum TaxID=4540 RepID=A0A3L6SFD9_PANMI|nr:hypothetical protein C2845_PM02G07690 [Panicum miliaceum]
MAAARARRWWIGGVECGVTYAGGQWNEMEWDRRWLRIRRPHQIHTSCSVQARARSGRVGFPPLSFWPFGRVTTYHNEMAGGDRRPHDRMRTGGRGNDQAARRPLQRPEPQADGLPRRAAGTARQEEASGVQVVSVQANSPSSLFCTRSARIEGDALLATYRGVL